MTTPAQIGVPLVASLAPKFTHFLVVDGTWKEKPNATSTMTKTGTGTENVMFGDPGIDAQCDLVLKKGTGPGETDFGPLSQGDKLVESVVGATSAAVRTWVVIDPPETSFKNGEPVKQTVKLLIKESLTVA